MAGDWGNVSVSDIGNFIKSIDFPASKQELISSAEENDAPQAVLDRLEELPDREFESATDVMKEAGKSIF